MELVRYEEISGIYARGSASKEVHIPLHPHLDFVTYMFSTFFNGDEQCTLIDGKSGRSLTRADIRSGIRTLARGMRCRMGIQQGDVVMILLPNDLHFPLIFNAVLSLGAVASPVNPLNTPQEIARQMAFTRPKLVFTIASALPKLVEGQLPVVIVPSDDDHDQPRQPRGEVLSYEELLVNNEEHRDAEQRVCIRQSDPAALLFSSGTTGLSKAVVISHGNLIATMAIAAITPDELLPVSDVILVLFPMYHVGGLVWLACGAIFGGAKLVLLPRYQLHHVLHAIQKYRVTKITSAPPVALDLLKSNLTSDYDLSSLRVILCAAAPLGKNTMKAVMSKFPQLQHFVQLYGMTETTTVGSGGIGPSGSTGLLKPYLEAKVVDLQTGKPLPPKEDGELLLRGPCIMQGYLNDPQATSQAIDETGWLHTGDLVHFDENGNLYIVDRLKELIKYKGYQVAPAELEAILLTHPSISDCAVVPFPDETAGELPMACIVKQPRAELTEQQVMDFIATLVSPYKKVRRVVFLGTIPKSAAGKILRKELKLQFASKL